MKTVSILAFLMLSTAAAEAADIKGLWLTEEGKAKVSMEACGDKLCGKIVSLKQANDPATGKPQLDALNENTALRTRPVVGINVLEVAPASENTWKGTVYNPEDGKSYSSEVVLKSNGSLTVKGCIVGGLLCEDEIWTRAN
jgi:uncharacterized protein (DUF2147 family)